MISFTELRSSQISTLLDSTVAKETPEKKEKDINAKMAEITKNDTITLASKAANTDKTGLNKTTDYAALEQKLGIDSSKWGVEAVSDDIFNFAKVLYEDYKKNHEGEEDQTVLENFYNMAKDSITKGYSEAMDFLGTVSSDVADLTKGTLDRSLAKLEEWFKNGGKDVEAAESETGKAEESAEKSDITAESSAKTAENQMSRAELLQESEDMKNQVLEMLKQQGIYLNEKATQKPFFEMVA